MSYVDMHRRDRPLTLPTGPSLSKPSFRDRRLLQRMDLPSQPFRLRPRPTPLRQHSRLARLLQGVLRVSKKTYVYQDCAIPD